MASYSSKEGFTLTWKVENFGYSNYSKGERLKTPFFYAYSIEWCLMLYPRGQDGSCIAVELTNNPINDSLDCIYSILSPEGLPLVWKKIENGSSFQNLVKRDEVFGSRKSTFLPNDTLTVQCRLLKKEDSSMPLLKFACTRVQVNRKSLRWDISNFNSLPPRLRMSNKFPPMTEYGSYLNIDIFLNNEGRVEFEITRTPCRALAWGFATCKVVALTATEEKIEFAGGKHYFTDNHQLWRFPSYITKSMLMSDEGLYLPKGTLSLVFEGALSSGVEFSRMEDLPATSKQEEESPKTPAKDIIQDSNIWGLPNTLSRNLHDLHLEGILSDFKLCSGGVQFPVHKQVLGARSAVFRAMFTGNMKERDSEGIDIPDVDPNTLRKMIQFMYTDTVEEDWQWLNTYKLYFAADKYELQYLKDRCAALLKLSVCVSNACELLVLADLHQDEDVKSTVLDFILGHVAEVVGTEQWKKLEEEHSQLALNTFRLALR